MPQIFQEGLMRTCCYIKCLGGPHKDNWIPTDCHPYLLFLPFSVSWETETKISTSEASKAALPSRKGVLLCFINLFYHMQSQLKWKNLTCTFWGSQEDKRHHATALYSSPSFYRPMVHALLWNIQLVLCWPLSLSLLLGFSNSKAKSDHMSRQLLDPMYSTAWESMLYLKG